MLCLTLSVLGTIIAVACLLGSWLHARHREAAKEQSGAAVYADDDGLVDALGDGIHFTYGFGSILTGAV